MPALNELRERFNGKPRPKPERGRWTHEMPAANVRHLSARARPRMRETDRRHEITFAIPDRPEGFQVGDRVVLTLKDGSASSDTYQIMTIAAGEARAESLASIDTRRKRGQAV